MQLRLVAVTAILACGTWTSAQAGQAEMTPFASWRAEFGGAGSVFRPTLSLGFQQQVRGLDAPLQTLRFVATPQALMADLGGIPLAQRQFRLNQDGDAAAPAPVAETHWYTHKWVWITAAGVGTVAALAVAGSGSSSSGHDDKPPPTQPQDTTCSVPGTVGSGCTVGHVGCIQPGIDCLISTDTSFKMTEQVSLEWLDEGTGQMGDLAAR